MTPHRGVTLYDDDGCPCSWVIVHPKTYRSITRIVARLTSEEACQAALRLLSGTCLPTCDVCQTKSDALHRLTIQGEVGGPGRWRPAWLCLDADACGKRNLQNEHVALAGLARELVSCDHADAESITGSVRQGQWCHTCGALRPGHHSWLVPGLSKRALEILGDPAGDEETDDTP